MSNLFDTKWFDTIIPGSEIIAVGTRDVDWLTSGKAYAAVHGKEEGIFESRPFVSVVGDDGKEHSCHLSRFHPVETAEI
jgi:hypothetical protein